MKKIIFLLLCIPCFVNAQVYPFNENFNNMTPFTNPAGWTCTIPGFQVYPNHGNGSQGLTKNMTALGAQVDSVVSPFIGPLTTNTVMSFDYRIVESNLYPAFAHDMTGGDALEFYAVSGPLSILLFSIDSTNHLSDTAFQHLAGNIGGLSGNSGNLMIMVHRGSGDFYVDIDNISISDATGVKQEVSFRPAIYPNPVNKEGNLLVKGLPDDVFNLVVHAANGNISGMETGIKSIDGNLSFPVTGLSAGAYLLELKGVRQNFQLRFVVKD